MGKCNLPYGYLWWISGDTEQGFSAMGDGGNVIYVNTHREMVVSIASLFTKNVKDRSLLSKIMWSLPLTTLTRISFDLYMDNKKAFYDGCYIIESLIS
ncbi:MAG: hypothetical protein ACLRMZ_14360 [Blautia marasmi]